MLSKGAEVDTSQLHCVAARAFSLSLRSWIFNPLTNPAPSRREPFGTFLAAIRNKQQKSREVTMRTEAPSGRELSARGRLSRRALSTFTLMTRSLKLPSGRYRPNQGRCRRKATEGLIRQGRATNGRPYGLWGSGRGKPPPLGVHIAYDFTNKTDDNHIIIRMAKIYTSL